MAMDAHVRDLRYFVAVAEELSFTRAAADRLHISQPALSKQIRHLERALRLPLFERRGRTVALTEAGAALLPRARQIIDQWEDTERAMSDLASRQQSTLVVGFQTPIGRGLIPAVTATMQQVLPGWRLQFRQISWNDPAVGLDTGQVDVAVAWLPVPGNGELDWRVVATEDRWVALPAGHRLAHRQAIAFDELIDEPFVALPPSAGALRDFWLATESRSTPARVTAEVTTTDETFEAVASGLGVVLLSQGSAENCRREDISCHPVLGLSPSELAVVWRASDHREAVRLFVESCARCLCQLEPEPHVLREPGQRRPSPGWVGGAVASGEAY